jgi:hypothetical protein
MSSVVPKLPTIFRSCFLPTHADPASVLCLLLVCQSSKEYNRANLVELASVQMNCGGFGENLGERWCVFDANGIILEAGDETNSLALTFVHRLNPKVKA